MQPGIGNDLFEMYLGFKGAKEEARLRGEEEEKRNRLMEIGGMAGKGDYSGAASKAMGYGDLGTGTQLLQIAQGQKKQAQSEEDRLAGALFAAKDNPEQWGRVIKYAQSKGIDMDPEEMDFNTGPTLLMQHMTPEGQLKRQNDDRKFAADQDYRSQTLDLKRQEMAQPDKADLVVTDIDGKRGVLNKQTQQFSPLGASPIRGKPGLSPTEFKAKRESETDLLNLEQTMANLGEAINLVDDVFEGAGAEALTYIGSKLPGGGSVVDADKANKTAQYGNIMTPEAIKIMADTLKGATTDFELRKFESILSDPSQPNNIKRQQITRMLNLAKNKHELETRRLQEFDERENGGQQPQAAPEQSGQAEPGEIPSDAIAELLADPSAAAEFDEVFGAGAAAQILEQQ